MLRCTDVLEVLKINIVVQHKVRPDVRTTSGVYFICKMNYL